MEYRDIFLGIRAQVPDGWLVLANNNTLSAHHPYMLTKMIFSSRLDANTLLRELVSYVQSLIRAPLNARLFRGEGFLEAKGYAPGSIIQQAMRIPPGEYVIRVYQRKPTQGWASHAQYLKELDSYMKFELLGSIEARKVDVPDPSRGMVAFKTLVPSSSQVRCYAQREAPVMDIRGKGYLISMIPPITYAYGNPMIVQPYMMLGAKVSPYMDAFSYARSALTSMGEEVKDIRPAPMPGSLTHLVLAKLGSTLLTGQQPMFSSALAELDDGYAWVTTIGESFMGAQLWSAYIYLARGKNALWILQSIAAHFRVELGWSKTLKRESNMTYRSVLDSIRSTSRLSRQIARSLEASRLSSYQPDYSFNQNYSDWSDDSGYDSPDYDSEWKEEPDTGTGMDTFYVDSYGQVRNIDLGEDVSFYEIDAEGALRDEEGNEVGYVEDGYVYDNQGNRLGWLDASISDDWQMERLEQESSDPSEVFGYYDWGAQVNEESTETPYYVTKEDDEDEEY